MDRKVYVHMYCPVPTATKCPGLTGCCYGTLYPSLNPLKPSDHYMHHQFNIQQLYALPTLYFCVLYLSENKQRLVQLTA